MFFETGSVVSLSSDAGNLFRLNKVLWTEAFLACWRALKSLCPYHVTGFLSPSPEDFIKYSHFKTDDTKWPIRIKLHMKKKSNAQCFTNVFCSTTLAAVFTEHVRFLTLQFLKQAKFLFYFMFHKSI